MTQYTTNYIYTNGHYIGTVNKLIGSRLMWPQAKTTRILRKSKEAALQDAANLANEFESNTVYIGVI